jgi:hypothetical protein
MQLAKQSEVQTETNLQSNRSELHHESKSSSIGDEVGKTTSDQKGNSSLIQAYEDREIELKE